MITARTTILPYESNHTATTTSPPSIPLPINWSHLTREEELKKEIQQKKEDKMVLKVKRKSLFTKKGLYL